MSDTFSDLRIWQLQMEEVQGKLRQLRQKRGSGDECIVRQTRELLELSATIREMSAVTREKSKVGRCAEGMHA